MRDYVYKFAILILVTVLSCTTKDGKIFSVNPEYGNLLVTSINFDGARIFLDHRDTGRLTPALLENVAIGRHVVHLFYSTAKSSPDSVAVLIDEGREQTAEFELNKVSSGDLAVNTAPDSASIYINKLEFGYSPLKVLGLPVGDYKIEIKKSNYVGVVKTAKIKSTELVTLNESLNLNRTILVEHISNTNCPPCPEADALIEDLLRDYGQAVLVGIGYHAYWPSNQDPLYLAAKDGNDDRVKMYYKPSGIPTAWVNGIKISDAKEEQSYRDAIDAELQKAAMVSLAFSEVNRQDSSLTGQVHVEAFAALPDQTVLRIALVEDVVDYEEAPGTNGQKHFEAVFRDFYPDGKGQSLVLNKAERRVLGFSFNIRAQWGKDLTVVAFLQNDQTKEVLQAAWTRYPQF